MVRELNKKELKKAVVIEFSNDTKRKELEKFAEQIKNETNFIAHYVFEKNNMDKIDDLCKQALNSEIPNEIALIQIRKILREG